MEVGDDKINAMIKSNQRYMTQEILEALHVAQSTIHDHLKKFQFISKLEVWVPHELKEIYLVKHLSICHSLLQHE